jgi:pimeloyl-ACP methyl ester carboxylesterase
MPLIFHIGTPMGVAEFEPLSLAAAARGLRTVMYSRPGYGRSTRQRGHTVADAAVEVRSVLDHLHADRFVTLGWSGGGPRALACAALFGDRCLAAISIGGVAPYAASDFEWLAGMTEGNVAEYSAALKGELALQAYLERVASGAANLQAEMVLGWLSRDGIVPETAPLAARFAEFVATSFRRSQLEGIWGWLDDDLALTHDWGFDLAAIERPVGIWQGTKDTMVPLSHGSWLAEHIPHARARFYEGHGHFAPVVVMLDRILDELLEVVR